MAAEAAWTELTAGLRRSCPAPASTSTLRMPELQRSRSFVEAWRSTSSGDAFTVPCSSGRAWPAAICRGRPIWQIDSAATLVIAAQRRGKYLWLVLQAPDGHPQALVIHLGMSGQLLVEQASAPVEAHLHATFDFADDGPQLRFVDQRTFGGMALADLVADERPAAPVWASRRASPTLRPTP